MHSSLFISDLHLSSTSTLLTNAFIALLHKEQQNQLHSLYIVGDWFDVWLGDDDYSAWLTPIVDALKSLHQSGAHIYVIKGNRDFLLGQRFCDRFGGQLLNDEVTLNTPQGIVLVEHGDRLCTDDVDYQKFRVKSRQLSWQRKLLSLPLWLRKMLAQYARHKSYKHAKHINKNHALAIMDVNTHAVSSAMASANAQILLHGHTHRPQLHHLANERLRLVLGDWQSDTKHAVLARLTATGIALERYVF